MKKSYLKPITDIHRLEIETMLQIISDVKGKNAAYDVNADVTYGTSLDDLDYDNSQKTNGGIIMSARDRASVDWDF